MIIDSVVVKQRMRRAQIEEERGLRADGQRLRLLNAAHVANGCGWGHFESVTLGNVTMSHRTRGPPNALRLPLNYDRSARAH
ncbi:hypothetical protein EVAR_53062_1 [Eumeta japonica]|uniref:Uncharacterized protein n=1 Tax=Eumeta variegata TaxID=151549 RepID=A0A4C1YSE9_EUMVA|nr:hypothetical protein EVAR_53062_1 [Eumeta japonica]